MSSQRFLIVNADDFGLSEGINQGIIAAHEHGILTSASLMVRWPAAEQAAAYARSSRTLDVGLHLDLGEMSYIDGQWRSVYEIVSQDSDEKSFREEVTRQIERFIELMGGPPTHIDSHQHRHTREPLRGVVLEQCERLNVPLRAVTPHIQYVGGFYGQSPRGSSHPECISVESLLGLLQSLPAGVTELGCHPAAFVDFRSTYDRERLIELETLCDARVRQVLVDLALRPITFPESAVAN
jgi:predicted glycoside hydrolase/deacetylase ChbG (UPF0249 family)